jgi:hypothetical protein
LLNASISSRPALTKITSETGHAVNATTEAVTQPADPYNPYIADNPYGTPSPLPSPRSTLVRIKNDGKTPKLIKEMAGNVSVQLDLQNVMLAKVENILKADGKVVDGVNGGALRVQSVKKLPNDAIAVEVVMDNLVPNPFGDNIVFNGRGGIMIRGGLNINGGIVIGPNGVRINGGGNARDLPDLLDDKGQKFKISSVANDGYNFVNGSSTRSATIVFAPNPGQGAPRDLILFGTRTHSIAVPFRFENVSVP